MERHRFGERDGKMTCRRVEEHTNGLNEKNARWNDGVKRWRNSRMQRWRNWTDRWMEGFRGGE